MTLTLNHIKAAIARVPDVECVEVRYYGVTFRRYNLTFSFAIDGRFELRITNAIPEVSVYQAAETMRLVRAELEKECVKPPES